jgi:uncharacterized protein YjbI with pentapeptide repeats
VFFRANLSEAILIDANLTCTDLRQSHLSGANLTGADLSQTLLIQTHLEGANLSNARTHGIAAWDLQLDQATKQTGLVTTRDNQPTIMAWHGMDSLEVAQFVYLLLNNQRIRDVIDAIRKKAVLILERFTADHKVVLDSPVMNFARVAFFANPVRFRQTRQRTLTETIQTLAGIARFVSADLTDAGSLPQELMANVCTTPSLAVQPLLLAGPANTPCSSLFGAIHGSCQAPHLARCARPCPAEAKAAELRGQLPIGQEAG